MNYTVIKALDTIGAGNATFNTTIGAVGTAIKAVDANFNATNTQDTLTQIMGAHHGYTNNLTTTGGPTWAAAYPNITGSTAISFTKTPGHKYINANTQLPAQVSALSTGNITVTGGGGA